MKATNRNWLLLVVLLASFMVPTAFANGGRGCDPHQRGCQQQPQPVPEGGSSAIYLLGAGLTCFGAMFLRSKIGKPAES
jgi:hypothetical protein